MMTSLVACSLLLVSCHGPPLQRCVHGLTVCGVHFWCSLRGAALQTRAVAKELHFNKGGETLKRMQAGVDKLASVVGVTLGPKGRNVVLESKCAPNMPEVLEPLILGRRHNQ